jgi:hypothetical protein
MFTALIVSMITTIITITIMRQPLLIVATRLSSDGTILVSAGAARNIKSVTEPKAREHRCNND